MTRVDQFESVFKSAAKTQFKRARSGYDDIWFITDRDAADSESLLSRIQAFLARVSSEEDRRWTVVSADESRDLERLEERFLAEPPKLMVSYRNLHTDSWRQAHSLGQYVDVLTQLAPAPVLIVPHPMDGEHFDGSLRQCRRVMAITDHLAGDHELVNRAADFTETGGEIWLTHIEDLATFERYMSVVSKIPAIDTDVAREEILKQLLKEPHDYIISCARTLETEDYAVQEIVQTGHHLTEYRQVLGEHEIDLLVMNTKDDDQLAMHGLAYPLAIEIRDRPILML